MVEAYPSPGEINRKISDPAAAIQRVQQFYESSALTVDKTDGISMEFDDWRFNLRMSNTEPVVRLNLETRADTQLLQQKQHEVLALLESQD